MAKLQRPDACLSYSGASSSMGSSSVLLGEKKVRNYTHMQMISRSSSNSSTDQDTDLNVCEVRKCASMHDLILFMKFIHWIRCRI